MMDYEWKYTVKSRKMLKEIIQSVFNLYKKNNDLNVVEKNRKSNIDQVMKKYNSINNQDNMASIFIDLVDIIASSQNSKNIASLLSFEGLLDVLYFALLRDDIMESQASLIALTSISFACMIW